MVVALAVFTIDGAGDVISSFHTGVLLRTVAGVAISSAFLVSLCREPVRKYFRPR